MQTEEAVFQPRLSIPEQRIAHWTWQRWLIPKPFDLVSSLAYLGVLLPFLYSFFSRSGYAPLLVPWQIMLMCVTIAILLVADRLEYRRYGERPPVGVALLLFSMRIILIEVLCWLDQFRYSPFLYLILLFLGCLYFGDAMGYGLGLLACLVYVVKHFWYGPNWLSNGTELHYLALFVIACVFAITIARVVLREQASRARAEALFSELTRSHQQLQDYADQVAELATTRERNRLAREIHDSLGHYLTVINVQLEKALTFRAQRPQEAEQAVSDAKRLASEALQDVRRSVSALRTTHELPAFVPALTELVERVRSERLPIDLRLIGSEALYSPQTLLTLYRAVQEGLTNIQKHAGPCHIAIDLEFGKQEAQLIVRDTGCGFNSEQLNSAVSEGCYGLVGLQERLELIGGNVTVKSAQGEGTTLHVRIPGKK